MIQFSLRHSIRVFDNKATNSLGWFFWFGPIHVTIRRNLGRGLGWGKREREGTRGKSQIIKLGVAGRVIIANLLCLRGHTE